MSKENGKTHETHNSDVLEKEECFIIMPFRDYDGYDTGHYRRVFDDLIRPACEKANLNAVREDDGNATNMIHLSMLQKIVDRPIAICDLSNLNPNVLYELGIRQAFDKPTVIIKDNNTPNIFDLSPIRYVNYKRELKYRDVLDEQNKIAEALEETLIAYKNGRGINSLVRLLFLSKAAEIPKSTIEEVNQAMLQTILYELKNVKDNSSTSQTSIYSTNSDIEINEIRRLSSNVKQLLFKLNAAIVNGRPEAKITEYYQTLIREGEQLLMLNIDDLTRNETSKSIRSGIVHYKRYQERNQKT